MKSQAQMSVLDGVLSIGVPTLSVLSGVLAHSVRVISVSFTGLENAMMISVEVLSAAVMLWWALWRYPRCWIPSESQSRFHTPAPP